MRQFCSGRDNILLASIIRKVRQASKDVRTFCKSEIKAANVKCKLRNCCEINNLY